jgi:hypothetical protein
MDSLLVNFVSKSKLCIIITNGKQYHYKEKITKNRLSENKIIPLISNSDANAWRRFFA